MIELSKMHCKTFTKPSTGENVVIFWVMDMAYPSAMFVGTGDQSNQVQVTNTKVGGHHGAKIVDISWLDPVTGATGNFGFWEEYSEVGAYNGFELAKSARIRLLGMPPCFCATNSLLL